VNNEFARLNWHPLWVSEVAKMAEPADSLEITEQVMPFTAGDGMALNLRRLQHGNQRSRWCGGSRGRGINYKNLFVLDGAIVPQAVGVNPSRTIAALAERAAALLNNSGRL
jgi:hypothetical protein